MDAEQKTHRLILLLLSILVSLDSFGQFVDQFNPTDDSDPGVEWLCLTGDGDAKATFHEDAGVGILDVDATNDRVNIWWALVKTEITSFIDLEKLAQPGYELRYEIKVKTPQAPKRMNMYIHTDQTDHSRHGADTNNSFLHEYDLGDTHWHRLSITTKDIEIDPDGKLFIQFSLMDWGFDKYQLMVDYVRAELVPAQEAEPDLGTPLTYRPPIPDLSNYQHQSVSQDVIISKSFPWLNYHHWSKYDGGTREKVLTVNPDQLVLLDFDFQSIRGNRTDGIGILELTVQNSMFLDTAIYEFGMIRISEILKNTSWDEEKVTFDSFTGEMPLPESINSQMIIDVPIEKVAGEKIYAVINQPVMNRLLGGISGGLAIRALGAVDLTLYDRSTGLGPRLYYKIASQ